MIGFFAAAIAAFFVLAYFQAPILAWTVAGGVAARSFCTLSSACLKPSR